MPALVSMKDVYIIGVLHLRIHRLFARPRFVAEEDSKREKVTLSVKGCVAELRRG